MTSKLRQTKIHSAIWLMVMVSVPGWLAAQQLTVNAEQIDCLPIEENAVGWAQVTNNQPETTTRLYFRRLHDHVEDVYYVEMHPVGDGRFWGVFPKAEDRDFDRHELGDERDLRQAYAEAARTQQTDAEEEEYDWARWWRAKELSEDRDPNDDLDQELISERASLGRLEERHWLKGMDDATFQEWLERQKNEPAEYFVTVNDSKGRRLARSQTMVAEVHGDCDVQLTPEQLGEAENLSVGETAEWQRDEQIFHWLCDGIVSRWDPFSVLRGDGVCRACVIAWWKRPGVLIPAAVATVGVTGIVIGGDESPPASPSTP